MTIDNGFGFGAGNEGADRQVDEDAGKGVNTRGHQDTHERRWEMTGIPGVLLQEWKSELESRDDKNNRSEIDTTARWR